MNARGAGWKFLMAALATLAPAVHASSDLQQVRVGTSASVYIYADTVVRGTGSAKVWSLWDHREEQLNLFEEPYRSARLLSEYDCKQRTVRLLEIVEFDGAMAEGTEVRSYPASDSEPRPVPPGSVGDEILQQVCAKPVRQRDF